MALVDGGATAEPNPNWDDDASDVVAFAPASVAEAPAAEEPNCNGVADCEATENWNGGTDELAFKPVELERFVSVGFRSNLNSVDFGAEAGSEKLELLVRSIAGVDA